MALIITRGARGSVSANRFDVPRAYGIGGWHAGGHAVFYLKSEAGTRGMRAQELRWQDRSVRCLLIGLSVSAVGLAGLAGCGDLSEFTKPITPAKISGEWRATDLVLTNANDPTISFDAIAAGLSLFLRFSIDGDYQQIIQAPEQDDDVEIGRYEIQGDFILVELASAPEDTIHFAYEFQESVTAFTLTLLSDDLDFDFDDDGIEEPALLFTILLRD